MIPEVEQRKEEVLQEPRRARPRQRDPEGLDRRLVLGPPR